MNENALKHVSNLMRYLINKFSNTVPKIQNKTYTYVFHRKYSFNCLPIYLIIIKAIIYKYKHFIIFFVSILLQIYLHNNYIIHILSPVF